MIWAPICAISLFIIGCSSPESIPGTQHSISPIREVERVVEKNYRINELQTCAVGQAFISYKDYYVNIEHSTLFDLDKSITIKTNNNIWNIPAGSSVSLKGVLNIDGIDCKLYCIRFLKPPEPNGNSYFGWINIYVKPDGAIATNYIFNDDKKWYQQEFQHIREDIVSIKPENYRFSTSSLTKKE